MRTLTKTALLIAVLALFQPAPADARGEGGLSRGKAVKAAVARYPGKVVKISDGKKHYQIRILQKNGRVVIVKVDKKSGAVSKSRKKGR